MTDETKHKYDLFVSYADNDHDWVQNYLLPELGLPLERIVTKHEFEPGAVQLSEIVRAIKSSRHTVLVLSPEYLKDNWATVGAQMVSHLTVSERSNRLIPLRLHPCDLPTDIAFRVSLDCTDSTRWTAEIARLRELVSRDFGLSVSPTPIVVLEQPRGAVPLDSPFYIRRHSDEQLEEQLQSTGTIITVRGARQTGKSSLLIRGIEYAKKRGSRVLSIDIQGTFGSSELSSLSAFLELLAYLFADQAQIHPADVADIWSTPLPPMYKMTRLMESLILQKANTPVILAIDEADILLETSFYNEFFGLLRAWYNRRVSSNPWKKLNIVIMVSTHPSLLISNISQSPFNVGVPIELQDLTQAQVQELNARHGSPLHPAEIPCVTELLGGQPYLIRQALYTLVNENMTWTELATVADRENGPFGGHLRYYLNLLYKDPDLMNAARSVVKLHKCPDPKQLLRLSAACLVREESGKCTCRYGLYKRFFGRQLS